jgi:hypothetical protein
MAGSYGGQPFLPLKAGITGTPGMAMTHLVYGCMRINLETWRCSAAAL